ncbi:MAG TPA: hypothetical protein PKO15_01285 [Fibrobacteria bacterium]|nr:hypothetical protein [Fibrobacteria bacterium]
MNIAPYACGLLALSLHACSASKASTSSPPAVSSPFSDSLQALWRTFTPASADWAQQTAGEYYVENNVWNKGDAKDYRQSVGIRKLTDGAISAGWTWEWPTSWSIVAFPDVIFGKNPWAPASTCPKLPARLSDIDSLHVDLDLLHEGEGHRNTSFQMWLTNDSAALPQHITHEIMIWIRNDDLPLAPFHAQMEVSGSKYIVSRMQNHGDPNLKPRLSWTYLSFARTEPFAKGRLDIKAFYDTLANRGLVDRNLYLANISLGNEVRDGVGMVVLKSYRISLKNRTRFHTDTNSSI